MSWCYLQWGAAARPLGNELYFPLMDDLLVAIYPEA
jgi:hypothetical protein